jgi:hypothetical protein
MDFVFIHARMLSVSLKRLLFLVIYPKIEGDQPTQIDRLEMRFTSTSGCGIDVNWVPRREGGGMFESKSPKSTTPAPPVRKLKIEADGDPWKGQTIPKIRLTGRWLDRAGFSPGNHVQVLCVAPGVIELRSPDSNHPAPPVNVSDYYAASQSDALTETPSKS